MQVPRSCCQQAAWMPDTSAGAFSAFVDIDEIAAQADTADIDIELVVLSV